MRADPAGNPILPMGRLDGLHFGSVVLAEGARLRTPQLILEQNVDGTVDDWLQTLVTQAGPGLDALFDGCDGYPGHANRRAARGLAA